jgi:hypothetical protein
MNEPTDGVTAHCSLGCTATENCKAIRDGAGSECPAKPFQLRTVGVSPSNSQDKQE